MSFFNFFGKSKQVKAPSPQMVIQNMKETVENLKKRESHLEKSICSFKEEARSLLKTNKMKALSLLKKAKMNEKHMISIYGQIENLETQIFALEQGINNQNTVESLKKGKIAIENMTKNIDVDDVGELVDDISANINMVDDVMTTLSQPIGLVHDEEDLLALLDDENPEIAEIPGVPVGQETNKVQEKIKKKNIVTEEEELAELVAMM